LREYWLGERRAKFWQLRLPIEEGNFRNNTSNVLLAFGLPLVAKLHHRLKGGMGYIPIIALKG
jgi:hypothetical protein